MTEQAAARRMRLLEELAQTSGGKTLGAYAEQFEVDERTIRRDVDFLQDLVAGLGRIALQRGRVHAAPAGFGSGYFSLQVQEKQDPKLGIARAVVNGLRDNTAIALTAGSTTYYVAREIRRAHVESERPRNLIAFTNSLPALLELIGGGVNTGVIGEVYNADDCAFHSHELQTSGVIPNPAQGTLDLFSHRGEEASFLKHLLAPIPELIVAVDASKIGHRHPWAFTNSAILTGKTVRLVTTSLADEHRDHLEQLTQSSYKIGCRFLYEETTPATE
jgi:DeoR/GlpR family transcriptional regulator of sugar metabolism